MPRLTVTAPSRFALLFAAQFAAIGVMMPFFPAVLREHGLSATEVAAVLAAAMLKGGGHRRILMLHGETPSRFVAPDDQATRLLFSDAGSATMSPLRRVRASTSVESMPTSLSITLSSEALSLQSP